MFGIGITELLVIAVAALIFIGPERLPQVMTSLAKTIRSLRNTVTDIKQELSSSPNDTKS